MHYMIYITGDTHGLIDFKKLKDYFFKEYVSERDYLIILGDAGILWSGEEDYREEYARLGMTIYFIDGNHENFDLLNNYPVVNSNGARCHKLCDRVYHVMRGEILFLNGNTFLCLGGATSADRYLRKKGESWWEEENISDLDVFASLEHLKIMDYKVDYILTHCAPTKYVMKMFDYSSDRNTDQLSIIDSYAEYEHWYFGHYHKDKAYGKFRCFYNDILRIESCYRGLMTAKYKLLEGSGDGAFLSNCETGRRTKLKEENLPEWYYRNYAGFSYAYYDLKGITDIAFEGSPFDNHISKDSRIYLSYHGRLRKHRNQEPFFREEWDVSTWRCPITEFILGINKYSPDVDTTRVKAQINLVYDQYNGGDSFRINNRVCVRPFPEIKTPLYRERYSGKEVFYEVTEGITVLSQFVSLERAKEYAWIYVSQNLGHDACGITYGSEDSDFIEAYDTGKSTDLWVYVKKINKPE